MNFQDETVDADLNLDPDIIKKAQDGDPSSQLELGIAYYHAIYTKDNCHSAFEWIRRSAENGNMEAQFKLGDMYALGHGVSRNTIYAHEWYTKSALQDYSKALIKIHNLYEEDKKISSRGELSSEEEGMNDPKFKKDNNIRELYEYRLMLMESKNLLGNTVAFFSKQFKDLANSKTKDKDAYYHLGFLYQHGYGIRRIDKRAMEFYTKAADQGHVGAQYKLGRLYQKNSRIKFHYHHAFNWYKLAAENGSSAAQNCLGYFYEKGLYVEMDLDKALDYYTQAAVNNDKSAMLNVARMYRKGIASDKDYTQSAKWYMMAAQRGSSAAKNCLHLLNQRGYIDSNESKVDDNLFSSESSIKSKLCSRLRLDISRMINSSNINELQRLASHALVGDGHAMLKIGLNYFYGSDSGFPQDKDTGFKWVKKAAKSGLFEAQSIVSKMYEEGETNVVEQDYYEASIWYALMAKKKNDVAQYRLGLLFYHGHGVRKDPLEASKWFTWSAEQGNSDSQFMLGLLRLKGEGLRKNFWDAFELFMQSASRRNISALYQLGLIYWNGEVSESKNIVKEDKKRSIILYKFAASQGNVDAQLLLAKMCEKGDHLEKSFVEAFKYYSMAASLGDPEANFKIGCNYLEGNVTEQNYRKAFNSISKAAEKHYHKAQDLFTVPIKTSNKAIDYTMVLEMFKRATQNGDASLEYNIGYVYENGLYNSSKQKIIPIRISQALAWYKKAGTKNKHEAFYRLGLMYQTGKGVDKDLIVASSYYYKGSSLGNIESLHELADMHLNGNGTNQDFIKAYSFYLEAANLGHKDSRKILNQFCIFEENDTSTKASSTHYEMIRDVASKGNTICQYQLGRHDELNGKTDSAIKWYQEAVQGKVTEAFYRLGKILEKQGHQDGYSKAVELYRAAMDKNHDKAMYRLARLYQYGIGVPLDYLKAFQLYTRASKQGNKSAYKTLNITRECNSRNINQENDYILPVNSKDFKRSLSMCEHVANYGDVGLQYKVGYVFEKILKAPEYEIAVEWYKMAASNSHRDATYRLGYLYANGFGVPQSWTKAIEYFEKAMTLGCSNACFELGLIYSDGKGVKTDKLKAKEYYIKAAEKGDSNAQYTVGKIYEDGEVVQKNPLKALIWYTRAYFQQNNNAIIRLNDLDDEQHSEAFIRRKSFRILQEFANRHKEQYTNEDPDFYGDMYYQLGYMYFYGIGAGIDYEKSWQYFNIAYRKYACEKARPFIIHEYSNKTVPDTELYLKKLKMFNTVIDKLDGDQAYYIGLTYYNGKRVNDNSNEYIKKPNRTTAFKFISRSSEQGCLKAQRLLADMYYYGRGTEINPEKAIESYCVWLQHNENNQSLQSDLKYYTNGDSNNENKYPEFIHLHKAANRGDSRAQQYLYNTYYQGKDTSEYIKFENIVHEIFASQQSQSENRNIGFMYYYGKSDMQIRRSIAIIYLQKVSDKRDTKVQICLGDAYYYGDGVRKDEGKAIELYKSSADNLSAYKNFENGKKYCEGSPGIKKNTLIGIIYLTKAAEQKDAEALRYLSDIYYYGKGVSKDEGKAIELYKSSANQLDNDSNFKIGQKYCEGPSGTEKNTLIGMIYLTKAAEQRNDRALRYLSDIYYYCKGVSKDEGKAIEFHKFSADKQTAYTNFKIGKEYCENSPGTEKNTLIGIIYHTKAADQEKAGVLRYLGDIYYYGKGVSKDKEKAIELHKSFADRLFSYRNFEIGQEYCEGSSSTEKNTLIGIIYLTKATEQKDAEALRYLSDIYYYGKGVSKDEGKVIELHKSFADNLSAYANFEIGLEYCEGSPGTKKNTLIGIIYLTKAAKRKNTEALRYLGDIYYYGKGVSKDEGKVIELHKSFADNLSAYENFEIGLEYCEGYPGIKKNTLIGIIYLTKAAEQKSAKALRYLGDIYYYGKGVSKDEGKAIELHKSSVKKIGSKESFNIGRYYYEGSENVKKSYPIAFIYFMRAFQMGYTQSQRYLGDMYYYGYGVTADQNKAFEFHDSLASELDKIENFVVARSYLKEEQHMKKNYSIAYIYLSKSASKGYYKSIIYLGLLKISNKK